MSKKLGQKSLLRRALSQPMGRFAVAMLLIILIMAILGATIMSGPATNIDPSMANKPISMEHWLGTDRLGRDYFARLAYATTLSLTLALSAAAIGIVGGLLLGSLGWFTGPRVGNLIAAAIRIMIAFPSLLLVLFASVIFGQGTVGSVLAVGVAMIPWYGRLVLNLVTSVREREYVSAALIQGQSRVRILFKYIVPNVGEPLIVNGTLAAGGALLAFAGLSYLGLGVQAPEFDWGLLLKENLIAIYVNPAPALVTALMIVIAGIGFNLLGESFAKSLDAEKPAAFTEHPVDPQVVADAPADSVALVQKLSINAPTPSGEPIKIVQDFDLDVRAGRIIGIVGESGSGKTLTAQAIAQVADESLDVQAITMNLDGISYLGTGASEDQRLVKAVGYIFQDSGSSFNPVMKFDHQIPEALRKRQKLSGKRKHEITVEQLERVGVPDADERAGQYPHQFSGGMRQRAMIAQATVARPRLVVADEPTTALDVSLKARILKLLTDLRDEDGASVIIISHDISALLTVVDDIVVMYGGRVVERGSAQAIIDNPQHPYTRALLQAVPSMDTPKDQPLKTIPGRPVDFKAPTPGCAFANRCVFATDICREVRPELEPKGTGTDAACHVAMAPFEGANA